MSLFAFDLAYDALRARRPESTEERDVATPYGRTQVHSYGPTDGSPVVLLPGGSATGLVRFANAPALGERHRIHAVDLLGDAGRTERGGTPLRDADDLTAWLDALLDGLGLARTQLCCHSYGAWPAARYALRAPQRVDRLALVDPTQVFAGFRPGYLLRALPTLIRPSEARAPAPSPNAPAGRSRTARWQCSPEPPTAPCRSPRPGS
ncbi:alpha/beta fold hydrolase [Streptomyces sp. NPDC056987]|uniref:alpha/beta fold hydrolase n=1 Tax=Streptomyces sp. NPDC056987 TaxID=3345988 RepID=UPI003627FCE8